MTQSIIPSNRLITLVVLTVLPCTLAVAFIPSAIIWLAFFVLLIVVLVFIDVRGAQGVQNDIRVSATDVLRISKGQTRELQIWVGVSEKVKHLAVGLSLPDQLDTKQNVLRVREIKSKHKQSGVNFKWPVTAKALGKYSLTNCYVETLSPMKLLIVRAEKSMKAEIRVYPNLKADQQQLVALLMNKNLSGFALSQVGKGREFEQLRDYIPGDPQEDIHWKATAKRRSPVTKMYQLERTQQIYTIIDTSRLSTRMIQETDQMTMVGEKYVSAALMMGMAAQKQGDHFGVITFDSKVNNFLRASSGKSHYNAVRDTLYTLKPKMVTPDYNELFSFIATKLRHRTLLIILTHLDDPVLTESFIQSIPIISRQHLILVNMLKPKGSSPLFSTDTVDTTDDMYGSLVGHMIHTGLNETKRYLKSHSVDFTLLDKETMYLQLISQYMNIKNRQIL